MSDFIKHECGIAFIRLRKPLQYFIDKYKTPLYAINKLQIMMEKQKNRGQDGAGVAYLKLNPPLGKKYFSRIRSTKRDAINVIFAKIYNEFNLIKEDKKADAKFLKEKFGFCAELLLGHLRYGTHGTNSISACHPFLRENNWKTRNLILAGNFNLTNTAEIFNQLVEIGQHPKEKADTVTVLEKIGHFLDEEVQAIFQTFKTLGYNSKEITQKVIEKLEPQRFLRKAVKDFDGGYAMVGMIGHGDAFILRDPNGIRPAYFYEDEEVIVAASERPAIQAAFKILPEKIKEVKPGNALIIKNSGDFIEQEIVKPQERKSCSFERIYFSRGNDKEIYKERKKLGYLLAENVLNAVDYDIENTVFSYIPNTAETAYYGLIKGLEHFVNKRKIKQLSQTTDEVEIEKILNNKIRVEKIAIKDAKMRTFITNDASRDDIVSNVYDVTWGVVKNNIDTLVVVDDSIVRGTTLKQSIISNLDKLCPKKIIILSTAPQIRYPDCYGIDMSKLSNFIAFKANLALIKENNKKDILKEIYEACKKENEKVVDIKNVFTKFYSLFTVEQISDKISKLVTKENINAKVEVIYQGIANLHAACPKNLGDWYFTGNYPTNGGNRVANQAFINFYEGRINERAY